MKHIIPALVAIVFIVAGGVGGHFLKSRSGAPATPDGYDKKADSHGAKKPKKDNHSKKGKSAKPPSSAVVYYKFSREFVVPIMRDNRVDSLIILNINLEADSKVSQELFSMEPKLRDNIMTTLITLSNDGTTFESFADVESYETIRSMIAQNLKNVI
ncbi:MAG: hypothetical protein L3J02_01175, partial [Henriciella sp.]|nr:hypothetical protein [Henriciella sp.]